MNLSPSPYKLISAGKKRVEMRLNDEKRANIKIGDTIEFTHIETNQKINCVVTNITHYKDFCELYSAYDKVAIGYGANEIADPVDMYEYYTQSQIEKYGVVAIEIKLL